MELTDALGMGYHAVIPDFKDLRSRDDDVDRGLGIYNLAVMPYRTVLDGVRRDVSEDGDRTHVRYRTPGGELTTTVLYDDSMRRAGISISHIESHAFQGPADYAPLTWLFEHARVEPNPAGYARFAQTVGERGVAVGFAALPASPAQYVMRDLMPLDTFYLEMNDHPNEMHALFGALGSYYERLLDVVSECAADLLLFGANYDASVTYPPFFAQYIEPWLRRCATALHQRGKFLLTHTDGENDGLLHFYLDAGVDVADSICPAPMTRLSFAEVRQEFAGRITIMGGIPSVALLADSMSDAEFSAFLDRFFEQLGNGERLILGISDSTPPQASFERLLEIGRRIDAFGPVSCA
jgi:hypothetical protein